MFGFLYTLVELIVGHGFCQLENVFTWLLPLYMTVNLIKASKSEISSKQRPGKKLQNVLCFWFILGLILGMDYLSCHLLFSLRMYRVFRLLFIVWLQFNKCRNAMYFMSFLKPMMDENEAIIGCVFGAVNNSLDQYSRKISDVAKNQFAKAVNNCSDVSGGGSSAMMDNVMSLAANLKTVADSALDVAQNIIAANDDVHKSESVSEVEIVGNVDDENEEKVNVEHLPEGDMDLEDSSEIEVEDEGKVLPSKK